MVTQKSSVTIKISNAEFAGSFDQIGLDQNFIELP